MFITSLQCLCYVIVTLFPSFSLLFVGFEVIPLTIAIAILMSLFVYLWTIYKFKRFRMISYTNHTQQSLYEKPFLLTYLSRDVINNQNKDVLDLVSLLTWSNQFVLSSLHFCNLGRTRTCTQF